MPAGFDECKYAGLKDFYLPRLRHERASGGALSEKLLSTRMLYVWLFNSNTHDSRNTRQFEQATMICTD